MVFLNGFKTFKKQNNLLSLPLKDGLNQNEQEITHFFVQNTEKRSVPFEGSAP